MYGAPQTQHFRMYFLLINPTEKCEGCRWGAREP